MEKPDRSRPEYYQTMTPDEFELEMLYYIIKEYSHER